jgi:hypothetical protein
MATGNILDRLQALEAEVAQIKVLLTRLAKSEVPWWKKIVGTFANDPAYDEAMRLGREYRESLRPKPRKRRKPGKVD